MSDIPPYLPERFLKHVRVTGSCWEWTGSKRKDGYGRYGLAGKVWLAHRAANFYATGKLLPPEIKICHRCDNKGCVNPAHLFEGTQADNVADMIAKGRVNRGFTAGEHNSQAKLTRDQVAIIRSGKFKGRDLARRFGVSESTISSAKRGVNWKGVETAG